MDFVADLAERTGRSVSMIVSSLAIAKSEYDDWRKRYGTANEYNGRIPRDFWLGDWEGEAIVDFFDHHPLEGYRRLTFMMLDMGLWR